MGRHLAALVVGTLLIAVSGPALAGPFPPAGLSRVDVSPIELMQAKKNDTVTQKVKRAWKNLTGYKFDVSCPFSARTTCTETGDSKGAARAKCISRNPICWVSDAN